MKAVAALRNQFGGHAVTAAGPSSGSGDTGGDGHPVSSAGPTSGSGDVG